MADSKLNIIIDTKGNVKGLDNVNKGLKGVGKTLAKGITKMAKWGAVAGAAGIGAALVFSVKKAADFESAMNRVGAITGATGQDFERLRDEAKQLGITTAFSATQAAEGMQALAQKGFKTKEVIASMKGVLDLAAGAQMGVGETAEISAGILNTFNLSAASSQKVMDSLAFASINSGSNVREFGEAMKFIGPSAQLLGVSMEETIATLGILGDRSITGSLAGTALGTSMARLAKPTKEMKSAMKDLNVEFFDSQGEFIGIQGTIGQLEDAFVGLNDKQKASAIASIFGQRAVKQWSTLVDAGAGKLGAFTDEIDGSAGAADRLAKGQLKGLTGAFTILKSGFEGAAIAVGDKINPALLTMTEKFQKVFQPTKTFGKALAEISGNPIDELNKRLSPQQVDAFGQAWKLAGDDVDEFNGVLDELGQGDVIDGLDDMGIGIEEIMQSFDAADKSVSPFEKALEKLQPVIKVLSDGFAYFKDNVLMPIGDWLVKNGPAIWDGIKDGALFLWEKVLKPYSAWLASRFKRDWEVLQQVIAYLKPTFDELVISLTSWYESLLQLWEANKNWIIPTLEFVAKVIGVVVVGAIKLLMEWYIIVANIMVNTVIPAIQSVIGFIQNSLIPTFMAIYEYLSIVLGPGIQLFKGLFLASWTVIKTVFLNVWDVMKTYVGIAWNGIKTIVLNGLSVIKGVFTAGTQILKGDWKGAWDTILNTIKTVLGRIKEFIGGSIDSIVNMFGSIGSRIGDAMGNLGSIIKNAVGSAIRALPGIGEKTADLLGFANGVRDFGGGLAAIRNDEAIGIPQGEDKAVYLPKGADVYNPRETKNMMSGGSTDNSKAITVNNYFPEGANSNTISTRMMFQLNTI